MLVFLGTNREIYPSTISMNEKAIVRERERKVLGFCLSIFCQIFEKNNKNIRYFQMGKRFFEKKSNVDYDERTNGENKSLKLTLSS